MPIGARYFIPLSEFYRLNPKKLQRYQPYLAETRELMMEDIHVSGWVYGQYVASSIASNFSKRHKYPKEPYFMAHQHDEEEGVPMTDADRFAAWAAAFNAGHKDFKKADETETNDSQATVSDPDITQ